VKEGEGEREPPWGGGGGTGRPRRNRRPGIEARTLLCAEGAPPPDTSRGPSRNLTGPRWYRGVEAKEEEVQTWWRSLEHLVAVSGTSQLRLEKVVGRGKVLGGGKGGVARDTLQRKMGDEKWWATTKGLVTEDMLGTASVARR